MAIAAPVIAAEMADWVKLGGGNSGIVGDPAHTYGFHLAANEVGPGDYSRWRDPNGADGPYVNWSYACAGDFRHGGDERLRAMHRRVLARLMAGQLPMICEFIGKPWADRPVYYWARWNGIGTLWRYTGAGHDLWSHISWYRSRANERAYLWTPAREDDMKGILLQDSTGIALVYLHPTTGEPVWANAGTPEAVTGWQQAGWPLVQLPKGKSIGQHGRDVNAVRQEVLAAMRAGSGGASAGAVADELAQRLAE